MEQINSTAYNDPSHDILGSKPHPLDALFRPKVVAVIGATDRPGSVGHSVFTNLNNGIFRGQIYPVSATHKEVLGKKAYKSVLDLPERPDLAVVVTPAKTVPDVLRQCVQKEIPTAVVISAGFKEAGPEGIRLENEIKSIIAGKLRIIGPNCLGIMNPLIGLNATFAQTAAKPGPVAFLSQSGALCTAILDWSLKELVGFSGFVSVGSMADLGWGDLIDYYGNDEATKSIVIYMESIGDARSFVSAARQVALNKPIIIIKAGRTQAAAKAAASHTGALTGSDDVLDAAFRRCGVLRVQSISDIFYMSDLLAKQPLPKGPRLALVTNAGGPGVLAADALSLGGGELANISQKSLDSLNAFLPSHWSHGNPVDVLGDADPQRYAQAVEIVSKDENSDGLLVIMTPQGVTHPSEVAKNLAPFSKLDGKPIIASLMGAGEIEEGEKILNQAGIPNFSYPDTAVKAFNYMWKYNQNLKSLYETPTLLQGHDRKNSDKAKKILDDVVKSGRSLLTEYESKQILESYNIPTVKTEIALTAGEAVDLAKNFGFPVVLKVHSYTITHKTDVGGVQLNLKTTSDVEKAFTTIKQNVLKNGKADDFLGVTVQPMASLSGYELILGSSIDPQFGPVILFGTGGSLVEVYRDQALALPPLNSTLARRMMEQTKIYTALKGVRGRKPVDLEALEALLINFSDLILENPSISQLDINPLLASAEGLIALDARVIVHPADKKAQRPAIRPYPVEYSSSWKMKDGTSVLIRPIRPEDEPALARFHSRLSERSVVERFGQMLPLDQRTTHERLMRLCFIDYDRQMALVCEKNSEIIGLGRLSCIEGTRNGLLTALVEDGYQKQGIGSEIVRRLVSIGKTEGYEKIIAKPLENNPAMISIFERQNFKLAKREGKSLTYIRVASNVPFDGETYKV
jgi:acetyltransferase